MPRHHLFLAIAEAFSRVHGAPLPKGLLTLGDHDNGWFAKLNTTVESIGGVPGATAALEWYGWPAGMVDSTGWYIAAGEAANERTLREWLATIGVGEKQGC